jgi:hypothetical protein
MVTLRELMKLTDCGAMVDGAKRAAVAAMRRDARSAYRVRRELRAVELIWLEGRSARRLNRAATPFTAARIDLEQHLKKLGPGRARRQMRAAGSVRRGRAPASPIGARLSFRAALECASEGLHFMTPNGKVLASGSEGTYAGVGVYALVPG